MSQLTKAAKAQKREFVQEYKSINSIADAILSAARVAEVVPFFEAAGVPDINASKSKKISFVRSSVLSLLPSFGGAGVVFSTNKEKAQTFSESATAADFTNCGELGRELGTMTDKGRAVYFFRTRSRLDYVIAEDRGKAGKLYKLDEKGERVREVVTFREYVCARGNTYNAAEVADALLSFLGVPAAIAKEAAEKLAEKAAKALYKAEQAAAAAATTAEKAQEQAKKASERAQEKAAKAAEVAAAEGMTSAQAAEIVGKLESEKAAKAAEQAEQASRAKGEQVRKKANTKTKASEQVMTK